MFEIGRAGVREASDVAHVARQELEAAAAEHWASGKNGRGRTLSCQTCEICDIKCLRCGH